mmetsp:Transcript_21235/g.74899  ORF Transcript_21235/g.74899 Transcript_21235/m.74899 type:complete len:188 (-) Transcript_21235:261-824(-)
MSSGGRARARSRPRSSKGAAAFGGKAREEKAAAKKKKPMGAAEQMAEQVARLEALGVETRPPPTAVTAEQDAERCKVWCTEDEVDRIRAEDEEKKQAGAAPSQWPVYTRGEAFQGYAHFGQVAELDRGRLHCLEFPVTLKQRFFAELAASEAEDAKAARVGAAAAKAKSPKAKAKSPKVRSPKARRK